MFCKSFVLLAIVLSVLQFMASDYTFLGSNIFLSIRNGNAVAFCTEKHFDVDVFASMKI